MNALDAEMDAFDAQFSTQKKPSAIDAEMDAFGGPPAKAEAPEGEFLSNALSGGWGRLKDIGYGVANLADKLPLIESDYSDERAANKEQYADVWDTAGGRVGEFAAEELALLPLAGLGKGLQLGKAAIKGGKAAKGALTRALASRSPVAVADKAKDSISAINTHRASAKEGLRAARKEQKRIQDRLLGQHIDDPKAWLAEQKVKLSREVNKGVPDLRDTRKFEENIATDFVNAGKRVDDLKRFRKSGKQALERESAVLNLAKRSPAYAPLAASAGLLGSHTARGAVEGAAGGLLLADEGDSLLSAATGGLIGGGLGAGSDAFSLLMNKGSKAVAPVMRGVGKYGMIKQDAFNKRWNKVISAHNKTSGLRTINPKLTNIFKDIDDSLFGRLATGKISPEQFAASVTKHHDLSDPTAIQHITNFARNSLAAQAGQGSSQVKDALLNYKEPAEEE